jgi:hypothetical protein
MLVLPKNTQIRACAAIVNTGLIYEKASGIGT